MFKKVRTVFSLVILLDGYNAPVIAVALVLLSRECHLVVGAIGPFVSLMLLASIVERLIAGLFFDRLGPKKLVIWHFVLFVRFSLIFVLLSSHLFIIATRFVVGLAVGVAYVIAPGIYRNLRRPNSADCN